MIWKGFERRHCCLIGILPRNLFGGAEGNRVNLNNNNNNNMFPGQDLNRTRL
jgi:hypothetical protein